MSDSTISTSRDTHVYDGREQRSKGTGRFEVVNPATEQPVGTVPVGNADDVDAAVQASRRAFENPAWRDLTIPDRANLLRKLADGFEARADEMAATITEENGSIQVIASWGNVIAPAGIYRYYADLIERMELEEIRPFEENGSHAIVRKEPVGVCGLIGAWNAPQGIYAEKIGPVIASGCTAVIKPAPETPFDAYVMMEIIKDAGIPDGVINVVFGDADTGRAIVRHPDVNKVSFTGSPVAGRDIAKNAGELLKPVTLELGGKSAAILLEDADIETFLPGIGGHCIAHSGQICMLSTRILAPRSRYDEVVTAIADTMQGMKIGDPADASTELGPVVSGRQRERIEGYIGIGKEEGAELVTGGGRPKDLDRGYYVEPTLFRNVDNGMRIAREEIFGPVLVAIPYDGEEEAIRIANDSDYGLGGVVYGADVEHATDVARRVETGSIGVNFYNQNYNAPFGGVKNSGYGRELGPEGLAQYFRTKSIYRLGLGG